MKLLGYCMNCGNMVTHIEHDCHCGKCGLVLSDNHIVNDAPEPATKQTPVEGLRDRNPYGRKSRW